jgi:hypothetical protein
MLLCLRRVGKQTECVQLHCCMMCSRVAQLELPRGYTIYADRIIRTKYIIFQQRSGHRDTNIRPAVVSSVKHKHTNKNRTHIVQTYIFHLNDDRSKVFKNQMSDRVCRHFVWSWNHINSTVLSVIHYLSCKIPYNLFEQFLSTFYKDIFDKINRLIP